MLNFFFFIHGEQSKIERRAAEKKMLRINSNSVSEQMDGRRRHTAIGWQHTGRVGDFEIPIGQHCYNYIIYTNRSYFSRRLSAVE